MWGGNQPGLPRVHDSEEKKASSSVMEVCHLASGRWEQKPTTGTPPLGVYGYASAVIGREIFFFGGYCGHGDCPAEMAVQERAVYMQDVQDLASTFFCKILLDVAVQDTWNILQDICYNKNVSFALHFSF